jgi:hypothetical protein
MRRARGARARMALMEMGIVTSGAEPGGVAGTVISWPEIAQRQRVEARAAGTMRVVWLQRCPVGGASGESEWVRRGTTMMAAAWRVREGAEERRRKATTLLARGP